MKPDINSLLSFIHNSVNVGTSSGWYDGGCSFTLALIVPQKLHIGNKVHCIEVMYFVHPFILVQAKVFAVCFFSSFLIQAFFPTAQRSSTCNTKRKEYSLTIVGVFEWVFSIECFFFSSQVDNLTQKIKTQKRYWKSAPMYFGSGFQCLFPTNFYFVKVANFGWQNMSLHWKNTFLQHEVYLGSIVYKNKFAFNLCDVLQVIITPNKI